MDMKAGFIGLGIMGSPMARNLLDAGVELLVNDTDRDAVERLVAHGAQAGSNDQIGASCEVVFLCVPNGTISQDILFGDGGAADSMSPGGIVCDFSSVSPVESKACFDRLAERGIAFVDAPVSGGEPGAIAGTLAIMCGGDQPAFDALQPYFAIVGASALLVGPSGSGSVTKLANQLIVNGTIALVSEAMVLATKAGADPQKVYEAIRGGLAGSAVLDAKVPMMLARDFKPGGPLRINHKDIRNVIDTAHAIDAPSPFAAQLFEVLQALKVSGHMGDDHGGIVQYFEALSGVTVQPAAASAAASK